MVSPSITEADRKRFLVWLKVGFALLVGGSMALVTLWSAAGLAVVLAIGLGATGIGYALAEFTFPDSIAETPYEDSRDRGPKPGRRTRERRERADEPTAADGDGRKP